MKRSILILLSLVISAVMLLSFAACTGKSDKAPETTAASSPVSTQTTDDGEEGGQNPIMNYIGRYSNGDAEILVEAEGEDGAKFTVDRGLTDDEAEQYTFSGTLDIDTLKVTYSDSTKKVLTLDAKGNVTDENVKYTDGSGTIIFHEDGTLEWQDENEAEILVENNTFKFSTSAD